MICKKIGVLFSVENIIGISLLAIKLAVVILPLTLGAMVYRDGNILALASLACYAICIASFYLDKKYNKIFLFLSFLVGLVIGMILMFICLAMV